MLRCSSHGRRIASATSECYYLAETVAVTKTTEKKGLTMRRIFLHLLLVIVVVPLAAQFRNASAQSASAHRAVSVSGLKHVGANGVRIDITLNVPPGADTAAIVRDALARRGAQPVSVSDYTLQLAAAALHWPQFFDHHVHKPFVPQYYNATGDTTPGGVMQALQSGEAQWSAVTTATYAVQYAGTTTQGEAFDGINVVSWPATWVDDPNAVAVTITTFNILTAEILDADTIINGQNFQFFANPVDLTPTRYDFRYVMLHENGHVAGLQHSQDLAAVMFPFFGPGMVGHGLAQDDINAISSLYPLHPVHPPHPLPAAVRVPEDFATVQLAVNNASAGDTIRVGPGRWCGARITKTLNLVGEGGATIMGCPAGFPGPVGNVTRRGFVIDAVASGTSISHFVFDGNGLSDTNHAPLSRGIVSVDGADNVVIDSNTFQGCAFGVFVGGNNYQVTHNTFDGFTILHTGEGGAAILEVNGIFGRVTGGSIQYNQITSTVPSGDFSFASWINEADVPFAGIAVSAQDGTVISNNKISITPNAHGDGGVGVLATDNFTGLTTIDLTISNNDGRSSTFGLVITNDQNGGTGNTVGAIIRGNLGVNLINGSTSNVRNRSMLLLCESVTGSCP